MPATDAFGHLEERQLRALRGRADAAALGVVEEGRSPLKRALGLPITAHIWLQSSL